MAFSRQALLEAVAALKNRDTDPGFSSPHNPDLPPIDPGFSPPDDPYEKYRPMGINIPEALANVQQPVMTDVPSDRPPIERGSYTGRPPMSEVAGMPTLDDRVTTAENAYTSAINERPQHSKWYKNAGIIAAQIVSNMFNPQNQVPIQSWGQQKKQNHIKSALETLQPLEQLQKVQQDKAYRKAQTADLLAKPVDRDAARQQKADAADARAKGATQSNLTRQYNGLPSYSEADPDDKVFGDAFEQTFGFRPLEKNADTKSEQIADQKTGQVYLIQTDKQGRSKVVKLMIDDETPFTIETKEQLASGDKAAQRKLQSLIADNRNVTSLKVAQINAGSRKEVANINQGGATSRANVKTAADAAKVLAAIAASAPKGSTPEQIQQKQQAYTDSLPSEIRDALAPK
jgi:hypothetical protein